jgi:RNA polymerase sigma-70 factor (ECF subfamily)
MDPKAQSFNVIGQLAALRRYALSLVRDPSDAEDLVHDALVKAYERQSTFRTGANIRNWLMSIVHNTHIDRLRQRHSQARRHESAAQLAEPSLPPNQDHSVRLRQLRGAFFALPEEQREALHLVAIEELSYQEAADALGIPVGTLMSRISRARARLRDIEQADTTTTHLRLVGGSGDDQQ